VPGIGRPASPDDQLHVHGVDDAMSRISGNIVQGTGGHLHGDGFAPLIHHEQNAFSGLSSEGTIRQEKEVKKK